VIDASMQPDLFAVGQGGTTFSVANSRNRRKHLRYVAAINGKVDPQFDWLPQAQVHPGTMIWLCLNDRSAP
jgi:hypothetical protein